MKKTTKRLVLAVLLFLLLLLTGYFILAFYYREGFSVNTWINGVYCTGKTVEEVNSELLLRTEAPNIVIVDREGTEYQSLLRKQIIRQITVTYWNITGRNRIRSCGWTMFCFTPGGNFLPQ